MIYGSRKILLYSVSITLIMLSIVYYSFNTARNISERYAPLVDAAMEIKLETTSAHLWFEEAISGDKSIPIEKVWTHLDQSEWYAHAMLEGGMNEKSTLLALEAPQFRMQIEKVLLGINNFRHIAEQRWASQLTSGVGSNLDQQFDEAFLQFIYAADNVESALKEIIIEDLQTFNTMEQLLMVLVLILGLLLTQILLRYNNKLNKQIRTLNKQEESLRITLNSIGDAVIVTDTNSIVTYINPIASKLTGFTKEEAIGQPLTTVFNIVHAQTRKQASNPVKSVLETGMIVGLANHTMLIGKDGNEYQISDSGAPIHSPEGDVSGVVLVFRDVTEEYTLNEELISSQTLIKTLLNTVPDMIWLKDKNGSYLFCNAKFEQIFNRKENNILGKTDYDLVDRKFADFCRVTDKEVLTSGKAKIYEESMSYTNSGHEEHHETIKTPMIDNNGNLIGVLGIARNITNYKKSLEQFKQSELRLKEVQVYAKIGYWELLADKKTAYWSDQMYTLFGLHKEAKAGPETLCRVMNAKDFPTFLESIEKSFSTGKEHRGEYRIIRPNDGEERWIECRGKVRTDHNGKLTKISGFIQDITEHKNAEERLQLSSRVFNDTHEGIMITDSQQKIVDINPAFTQITGYSHSDIIGKSPSALSSGKQSPKFYEQMWLSVKSHGYWQGEVWNRTKQGELYAELLTISSLANDNDEVSHYVGVFSDITVSKRHQDQLNLMAHYDVLTKLPNRALFVDRFNQSIAHSIRTGHQLAVCFLDLDDFKPVNDNYGHEAGDRLLIEVAKRITACIREEDTVSRQGGDEFAILLNDIESAPQYEKTMMRIHQALAQPYFIDDIQHNITASSGVTLYPADNGDIDTLLRHADHAMYQSKLSGKHRFILYSPDSDQRIIEKNIQLDEIGQALKNHQFQLYYQPKVNMVTGDVFGAEALIRWIHPIKGIIPPLDFLPLIDDTPLEIKVGEWVINQALLQIDAWQQQGIELEVSVNISSSHLLSPTFMPTLEQSLAAYPSINPIYLQLEILESSALGDTKSITHIIEACQKKLGVNFSLDDFGTGYSSLTHLRSLPVETIKIDQSFVRDMLDDPSDYSIIDGVIALSKSFDKNVIAEGVESTKHGLILLLMGCDKAQGYAIAKPMPNRDFINWINSYTPNEEWCVCGQQKRSHKESSLEIFNILSHRWKNKFKNTVESLPKESAPWPILDSKMCHCASWLHQRKQERLFDKENIQRLDHSHNEVHRVANEIQRKYKEGNIKSSQELLKQLDIAYENMSEEVKLCE